MGTRACITMFTNVVVAGFLNMKCSRASSQEYTKRSWLKYFKGASETIIEIAEQETTQYLLDKIYGEEIYPYLTTAFWQINSNIVSNDEEKTFYENGGSILSTELLSFEEAIPVYHEQYEFTDTQIEVIHRLYLSRVASDLQMIIQPYEYAELLSLGNDGFYEFKSALEAINMRVAD